MTDDIGVIKQAEEILEKATWDEFWREYEGAVGIGAWEQAHDLLVEKLIPELFAMYGKMVATVKVRDELINKYKELARFSGITIKRYEGMINEYERRGVKR